MVPEVSDDDGTPSTMHVTHLTCGIDIRPKKTAMQVVLVLRHHRQSPPLRAPRPSCTVADSDC